MRFCEPGSETSDREALGEGSIPLSCLVRDSNTVVSKTQNQGLVRGDFVYVAGRNGGILSFYNKNKAVIEYHMFTGNPNDVFFFALDANGQLSAKSTGGNLTQINLNEITIGSP